MKTYNVGLWSGVGYTLDVITVEANHEEEAVERAVAAAEAEGLNYLFLDGCGDLHEMEDQGRAIFIDATMEGAASPHYIFAENPHITEM